MSTTSPELLIPLDRSRPRGLRAQIEDELRLAIRDGRLTPGTSLPSTRALAADLGVTRGVVVNAYDQLIAEGYLVSRAGSGTVVNRTRRTEPRSASAPPAGEAVEIDFRPGLPDLDLFPRTAWARATRTALRTMPSADLGYGDPRGLLALRRGLAEYLARVRGVSADPEHLVVCDGFGHGFGLVAQALRDTGRDLFAVEDPGYDATREELGASGIRFRGVEIDGEGLVVEQLRRTRARVVVVTPAHQSPTGVVLSAGRRRALTEWARDVDGYVIEDDYDAEYRYDRRPVGAFQGVAPDRVVYCGTASKSLAPGVRLGWLVLPPELVDPVVAQRRVTDGSTSALLQATYAAFLADGDLDRHLRRTRRVYRRRRDALVDALQRVLPEVVPGGVAAGLHVLVTLPDGVDEVAVAERALAAGVRVYPLAGYRAGRRSSAPPGLVLGYGSLQPEEAERGVALLAGALGDGEWVGAEPVGRMSGS
jgi:GntR family transcriptional regulator/MocR family aminotransferase